MRSQVLYQAAQANGYRAHIKAPILQRLSILESAMGNPNAACDGAWLRYEFVSSHCRSQRESCEQVRFCQIALGPDVMTQRATLLLQHISLLVFTTVEKRLLVGQEHANNRQATTTHSTAQAATKAEL